MRRLQRTEPAAGPSAAGATQALVAGGPLLRARRPASHRAVTPAEPSLRDVLNGRLTGESP